MALFDDARRRGLIDQIPTGGLQSPAADGSQNNPLNTEFGRNLTNLASALPGSAGASFPAIARTGGAISAGLNTATRALGGTTAGVSLASAANSPAVAGTLPPSAGAGRGFVNPPSVDPSRPVPASPSPAPQPQPQNQLMPGVYQHGRGQYSDQAGGMGLPGNFTGRPNERNMAAADNLAGQQGLASYAGQPSPAAPASSNSVPLIEAAGIRHSGNDWAARQNLKNLETSASSITNRPEWRSGSSTSVWGGRQNAGNADPDGKIGRFNAAMQADAALQLAEPAMAQAAMRENAGLQREGMQQAGADRRATAQTSLAQQRLAMEQETQGYANRAAGQTEQLRGVLLDPNATPQQRQSAQQALMTLSGHQPADPYLVVPGGQQVDPNSGRAYTVPSSVLNRSTGQFLQQPGQGAGQLPPGMTRQVGTSARKPVYEDEKGNRFVAG